MDDDIEDKRKKLTIKLWWRKLKTQFCRKTVKIIVKCIFSKPSEKCAKLIKKNSNGTQAPNIFCFTLLVMLGNYGPTCIVTIKMVTM